MTTPFYAQGGGTTPVGTIPVIPVISNLAPSSTDVVGKNGPYPLGQTWIDRTNNVSYTLVNLSPSGNQIVATWAQTSGGTGGLNTLSGNTGTATPIAGNIQIAGVSPISTSASGGVVSISYTGMQAASEYDTNVGGPVMPNGSGVVFLNASTTTYTDGSTANTIKTEVQSSSGSILVGAGTNTKSTALTPDATAGIPIVSNGSAPVYGTAVVAGGGTGDTSFTPYTVICAGTTSTGALQNVSGTGTTGQVLMSNGSSALPTWGNTSATLSIEVDTFTSPGTNPVVPTVGGEITITGGQVPAGTVGSQCLRTDSLAANSLTIQVQRSAAAGTSSQGNVGVCSFNSSNFTVDSNGYVSLVSGSGFTSINIQTFTTSGTYTPTMNMQYCIIEVVGGGAGGGASSAVSGQYSAGAGGGGGEYARGTFSAFTIGASQTVTIGSGGSGGTVPGGNGASGGNSSVGSLISANGGSSGTGSNSISMGQQSFAGGAGGTGGSGGSFRLPGGAGGFSYNTSTTSTLFSGAGGTSVFSQGTPAVPLVNVESNQATPGNAGTGYGGGGSGALSYGTSDIGQPGGAGTSGVVIITEFIS